MAEFDAQILTALNNINTSLATLTANYGNLCADLGEVRTIVMTQNGRVRSLEQGMAVSVEDRKHMGREIGELKADSKAKGSLIWNAINTVAVAFAAYLGLNK